MTTGPLTVTEAPGARAATVRVKSRSPLPATAALAVPLSRLAKTCTSNGADGLTPVFLTTTEALGAPVTRPRITAAGAVIDRISRLGRSTVKLLESVLFVRSASGAPLSA